MEGVGTGLPYSLSIYLCNTGYSEDLQRETTNKQEITDVLL